MPSISEKAEGDLHRRINCKTARSDVAALEGEKASVEKQALAGVRSVVPFAAASGILMGDYAERAEVATGQYNRDIEAKIAEIRTHCGLK